jgi:hypothetical protein
MCYKSIPLASKCDRLDRAMLILAFLDSSGVFFMLATFELLDCTFCTVLCVGTPILLSSGQGGTERKRHRLLTPTVHVHYVRCFR